MNIDVVIKTLSESTEYRTHFLTASFGFNIFGLLTALACVVGFGYLFTRNAERTPRALVMPVIATLICTWLTCFVMGLFLNTLSPNNTPVPVVPGISQDKDVTPATKVVDAEATKKNLESAINTTYGAKVVSWDTAAVFPTWDEHIRRVMQGDLTINKNNTNTQCTIVQTDWNYAKHTVQAALLCNGVEPDTAH